MYTFCYPLFESGKVCEPSLYTDKMYNYYFILWGSSIGLLHYVFVLREYCVTTLFCIVLVYSRLFCWSATRWLECSCIFSHARNAR